MLRFACFVLFVALLAAPAANAQSVLYVHSLSGDFVGQGATAEFDAPDWTFAPQVLSDGELQVFAWGPNGDFHMLTFATPNGAFTPGPYEMAARSAFRGPSPGLDVSLHGAGCNEVSGRFVILDADITGTTVNRFAANFEQWCDNDPAPLYGELRINSAVPLSKDMAAGDSYPDPFALVAQNPVATGALVESNPVTVYGVNTPVPVSVTGGTYSINGSTFQAGPGVANALDHIRVRLSASMTPGESRTATLAIGGQVAQLQVTTYAPGMALSGIYYSSSPGDYIGGGETFLRLAPANRVTTSSNFDNGVSFRLQDVLGHIYDLDFAAPGNTTLFPGQYDGAMRYPFQDAADPGLDLEGNGRGCNQVAGSYTVREAAYDPGGSPATFAADFVQRCEITGPPLYGEVRWNSTVPFSALQPALAPLSNISTRGDVLAGENVMISGFVIGGTQNKTVAVVATGPSLASAGIANPLSNPTLTIVRSLDHAVVASNDDWQADPAASLLQADGFAPPDPRESAILVTLPPGAYTAVVSGAAGGTGVAVAGVYEVDQPVAPLINLSTRGRVGNGEDVLIGGFVVQGDAPRTVAIVGTGPSLAAFGVSGPLANPTLTLVRSSDRSIVAENDDWQSAANSATLQQLGFAPTDPRESAILVTLDPGAYTAILSGAGAASGVGVVGVYSVQ